MTIQTVAFIGTGVMGSSMARHLLEAGFSVNVFSRTRDKAVGVIECGACWADSVAEAVSDADAVITMVGYPADVEEVYLGDAGIIAHAKSGATLIDMTTSSPALAVRLGEEAMSAQKDLSVLDAPVSGGDIGARNATLTIMVGGEQESFDRARPLFEAMGKTVSLHGAHGAGQHCKMANQIMIAATMVGMSECLAYAKAAGLDPDAVIHTLSGGSAQNWSLANYGPRILAQDYSPGFFVKHFKKDLRIALEQAELLEIGLPGTELAYQLYDELDQYGGENLGTQALYLLYGSENEQATAGLNPA